MGWVVGRKLLSYASETISRFPSWISSGFPAIGRKQPLVIALHGETQAKLDLSVGRSRLRGGFRMLQHSVQRGAIKFFSGLEHLGDLRGVVNIGKWIGVKQH